MVKRQAKKRTQQQLEVDSSGSRHGGRRLLTKLQHSIGPRVVIKALPGVTNTRDALDSLKVECSASPRASLRLAYDRLTKDPEGYYNLDVEVRDVVAAPNMTLQIEATVEWYKRPDWKDVSEETDTSKWPAAEPPVKVTLDGPGRIGSFDWYTLRALTVHLEVYALDGCALSGVPSGVPSGLNAMRLERTLTDVELKVDGEVFSAHRNVLAVNSTAFRSMFTIDLKEAKEGVVEIEGTSSKAFGVFLEFLYTARVADWKDSEVEVLELADRYLVDQLKAVCEERLLSLPRLALEVLQEAGRPAISSDLRAKAMLVLMQDWEAVRHTAQWRDFEASNTLAAEAIQAATKFKKS